MIDEKYEIDEARKRKKKPSAPSQDSRKLEGGRSRQSQPQKAASLRYAIARQHDAWLAWERSSEFVGGMAGWLPPLSVRAGRRSLSGKTLRLGDPRDLGGEGPRLRVEGRAAAAGLVPRRSA